MKFLIQNSRRFREENKCREQPCRYMEKLAPGKKNIQKSGDYQEDEVVPDEESEHYAGEERFAVRSTPPDAKEEIGTFQVEVLNQDNFYISED